MSEHHYLADLCCKAGHVIRPGLSECLVCTRLVCLQGRRAEAEAIMSKIAEGNGTRMPLETLTDANPAPDPATVAAVVAVAAESGALITATTTSSSASAPAAATAGAAPASSPAAGVPAAVAPAGEAPLTLGAMLKFRKIARRFFILAYVWCTLWWVVLTDRQLVCD